MHETTREAELGGRRPWRLVVAVAGICGLALVLRLTGLDWDQGTHLHPDERFLTMVSSAMRWPASVGDYFNTSVSKLNPHNIDFGFYVYGTWPVILVKAVADLVGKATYRDIPLVGRALSAGTDMVTLLSLGYIAGAVSGKLFRTRRESVLAAVAAMGLYATAVLPLQMTHYFTVDPYLVAAATLTIALSIRLLTCRPHRFFLLSVCIGMAAGAAVAAKIQGALLAPLVAACLGVRWKTGRATAGSAAAAAAVIAVTGILVLRIMQPYLFSATGFIPTGINPKTVDNWKTLKYEYDWNTYKDPARGIFFPPATMFISTKNYLFPLENMVLWGSGIPLSVLVFAGYALVAWTSWTRRRSFDLFAPAILAVWSLIVFAYQGQEFAKYLRYFYILYPTFAVLGGIGLTWIWHHKKRRVLGILIVCGHILYTASFMSVYLTENTRVAASRWMYRNIPAGSTIATEYWDDGLPLCLDGLPCPSPFSFVNLPFYDSESSEKWNKIAENLRNSEYIVLSSNRLYGSIGGVPDRYPDTVRFYDGLFSGRLGYTKVAEFTSRPGIPLPLIRVCLTPPGIWYGKVAYPTQRCDRTGIWIVDDYADESFTVYDHPKVTIFRKDLP